MDIISHVQQIPHDDRERIRLVCIAAMDCVLSLQLPPEVERVCKHVHELWTNGGTEQQFRDAANAAYYAAYYAANAAHAAYYAASATYYAASATHAATATTYAASAATRAADAAKRAGATTARELLVTRLMLIVP